MIRDSGCAAQPIDARKISPDTQMVIQGGMGSGYYPGQLHYPSGASLLAGGCPDHIDQHKQLFSEENHLCKGCPDFVATGFTTAYLGDERTLREFILGDQIRDQLAKARGNCILYLINDSYDALTYPQLRVALKNDEKLLAQFKPYCGRPIAEIPDPFGCHQSYSEHFSDALLQRLHSLDIHPVVLDAYQAYRNGYYDDFITVTLENHAWIQESIARHFAPFSIPKLVNVKCPRCGCIDATTIHKIIKTRVRVECERCGSADWYERKAIQGKLSWKLGCAARWNLYGIDVEPFSKHHLSPTGTFSIAEFISRNFFGGRVPVPVKYGTVQIDKELSNQLLEILPPEVLKKLFMTNLGRDIHLTRESVENFCRKAEIRPGISYVEYVQAELPLQALRFDNAQEGVSKATPTLVDERLIIHGKRFAKFYYDKEFILRFPNAEMVAMADKEIAQAAWDVIHYAISVRDEYSEKGIGAKISNFLADRNRISKAVVQYLRRLLGQPRGPRLSTLLTLLPRDYLNMIEMVLGFYADRGEPAEGCQPES